MKKIFTLKTSSKATERSQGISAEHYYKQGYDYYYNQGKKQEALECFDQAIALNPKYTAAYADKGRVLEDLKWYKEAFEALDQTIKLDPLYVIAYYIKVSLLVACEDWDGAEECYSKAEGLIDKSNFTAYVYFHQGKALSEIGRREEAVECYDKAIKLNPNFAFAYNNKGLALHDLGRKQEAIECYDKARKINPNYVDAYNNKYDPLCSLGKTQEEAIKLYNYAIKLNPKNAEAYYYKGRAFDELCKKQEAIECYNKAIKLDPKYTQAYAGKGAVLKRLGKHQEAIQCYNKAIQCNPKEPDYYFEKGTALSALGKNQESIECFENAIKLSDYYKHAYNNKGEALYALGRVHEAIECFDEVIGFEGASNDAVAYYNKGDALFALGRDQEANACYEKAVEAYDNLIGLCPEDSDCYYNKGYVLERLGRHKEAIECYDKAIHLKPNEALYYCGKGKLLNFLGKEDEALACFNNAYEISKSGNLREDLSPDNINYIKYAISEGREELLKKVSELQKFTTEASNEVNKLNLSNPLVKKVVEKFKALKAQNNELTNQAINSLDPARNKGSSEEIYRKSILLSEQMGNLEGQLQALIQEVKELKQENQALKKEHVVLQVDFVEVKNKQQKQEQEIGQHAKHLEIHDRALEGIQQLTFKLKARLKADAKVTDKDKELMESRINAIAKKMNDLVNKEDVEAITVEMTKLMNDAKITKGRLADLEDDIDNILERQERAEGRLEQLELFKQIAAEMQAKLKADISASQKDKELMENRINAIAKKINDLVNKEDVEAITVEMTKLMNDAKITKGRLADLEDDIDSLINAQENGQTLEVYALNEIVYDNLLLNHMYLLKEVGKYIRMCDAIGLSGSLSQELVSEAIHNQDQDLVWAGILSLTGRQTE